MKKWIAMLLFLLVLFSITPISAGLQAPEKKEKWETRFERQVDLWMKEITAQQGGFSAWKEATKRIEPLGPNSRSWLVLLLQKGEEVGYMVVGEDESGAFLLLEYGLGGTSLFSDRIFSTYVPGVNHPEKVYRGLSSYYFVRKGRGGVYDGKSFEAIPPEWSTEQDRNRPLSLDGLELSPERINRSFLKKRSEWEEAFPVEAILKQRKKLKAPEEVMQKAVYLETAIWNRHIHLLLPVVGLQRWDKKTYYIAVDQEGYRFLPLLTHQEKREGHAEPSVSLDQLFTIASDS